MLTAGAMTSTDEPELLKKANVSSHSNQKQRRHERAAREPARLAVEVGQAGHADDLGEGRRDEVAGVAGVVAGSGDEDRARCSGAADRAVQRVRRARAEGPVLAPAHARDVDVVGRRCRPC